MHAPRIIAVLADGASLSVCIAACSSPTKPSVSVASASPVSPANGAQVVYNTQPVKLVVDNGVSTGGVSLSDTFEVATDSGFATLVVSKSVSQTASGQTSFVLDPLPPATYYWRVRGTANNAMVTSPTFTFNIAVALPPPVLVSPASGVLIGHLNQPITLIVENPVPSSPVSGITNSFDVATDSSFANILISTNMPQPVTGPPTLVLDPLPPHATYYWRVRVAASGAIGAVSATASFRIGPALVSGSYRLTINTVITDYMRPNGCQPGSGTQFTFDGNLTLAIQTLVFTLPRPYYYSAYANDLAFRLTLAADRVSGSIISNQSYPSSYGGYIYSWGPNNGLPISSFWILISKSIVVGPNLGSATPVNTAGSVGTDGRVTGAFDGYVAVNYYDPVFRCTGQFNWSLAPR